MFGRQLNLDENGGMHISEFRENFDEAHPHVVVAVQIFTEKFVVHILFFFSCHPIN